MSASNTRNTASRIQRKTFLLSPQYLLYGGTIVSNLPKNVDLSDPCGFLALPLLFAAVYSHSGVCISLSRVDIGTGGSDMPCRVMYLPGRSNNFNTSDYIYKQKQVVKTVFYMLIKYSARPRRTGQDELVASNPSAGMETLFVRLGNSQLSSFGVYARHALYNRVPGQLLTHTITHILIQVLL